MCKTQNPNRFLLWISSLRYLVKRSIGHNEYMSFSLLLSFSPSRSLDRLALNQFEKRKKTTNPFEDQNISHQLFYTIFFWLNTEQWHFIFVLILKFKFVHILWYISFSFFPTTQLSTINDRLYSQFIESSIPQKL